MAIPFFSNLKRDIKQTGVGPLFVDTIKRLPQAASETIGQPSMRAYAGVADFITGKPLTPSTPFQKDLYGTDKPITFRSVGEEVLPQGNKFAPVLGAFFGLADLVPSGKGVKQSVKVSGQVSKKLLPKSKSLLPTYKGAKDLTTQFLDYAKGKTILSRQEILDFAKRPELKKGEVDLLKTKVIEFKRNKLPAQDFADSIRGDLLELKPVKVKNPEYRPTTIGNADEDVLKMQNKIDTLNRQRKYAEAEKLTIEMEELAVGGGKNYEEVVFESPITTNGSSHFPNSKNYFAHARGDEVTEGGKGTVPLTPIEKERYTQMKDLGFDRIYRMYWKENNQSKPIEDFVQWFPEEAKQLNKAARDFLEQRNIKTLYRFGIATKKGGATAATYMPDLVRQQFEGLPLVKRKLNKIELTDDILDRIIAIDDLHGVPKGYDEAEVVILPESLSLSKLGGKKIWREQEIQSDLLQKENLRMENLRAMNKEKDYFSQKETAEKDILKLQPFTNDRFGERIMRERIKEKASKGYEKYRLPTGETIGKIEGFEQTSWAITREGRASLELTPDNIKVGQTVHNSADNLDYQKDWIITDILGDGRFKAVPKNLADQAIQDAKALSGSQYIKDIDYQKAIELLDKNGLGAYANRMTAETFDLTGKSNPQYRRYENWGKFLKNKLGGKEITDAQGNTWMEVNITGESKKAIPAFGGHTNLMTLLTGTGISALAPLFIGSKTSYKREEDKQKEPTSQQNITNFRDMEITSNTRTQIKRSIMSEISNRFKPIEVRAILHVAINKAKEENRELEDILSDPNFIQGVSNKRYTSTSKELKGPDKDIWDFVSNTVDDIIDNKDKDFTNGATHFIHITSGKMKDAIVTMTEKEFTQYLNKKGQERNIYAESLLK